jgi:SAM-dependent methyltransferase
MLNSPALAKALMRIVPRHVDLNDWSDCFFFSPEHLRTLSPQQIEEAMFKAADDRRRVELEDRILEIFFGPVVGDYLRDRTVLDFGAYFGGAALAWQEMYGIGKVYGFDVEPIYAQGANAYAKQRHANAEFTHGFGEKVPYAAAMFDTVVAVDVFEHVHDVEKCLLECRRVLRSGGHLLTIFPPFFHPLAHHLKVSSTPFLHWLFSGEALRLAQNEIWRERGPQYDHFHCQPSAHYRIPTLNGITVRRFWRLVRAQGWHVIADCRQGVPRVGRRAQRGLLRAINRLTTPFARLPVLDEIFLDRVAVILRRP